MLTVLLAVYNGEKYLRQQLDSLLNQTYKDFNVLIHDDCSSDGTLAVINEYVSSHPEKFVLLEGEKAGSACANFSYLLNRCDSDYIMFCDQDDFWFEEKIEKTFERMKKAEAESGKDVPVLVHSNLSVADGELNVIDPSFFHFQGIGNGEAPFSRILVQNYVTGCTVMINKALKEKCGEVPKEAAMHDWWLALVASLFGRIEVIKEPLMYYRQHSFNQVGAKSSHGASYVVRKLKTFGDMKENYLRTYIQARILRQRYQNENIDPQKKRILNAYCNMSELGKVGRIRNMNRYDFKKSTKLRRIGQYIII